MSSGISSAPLVVVLLALVACPEASPAAAEVSSSPASVAPDPALPAAGDEAPLEPAPAPEPLRQVSSGLDLGAQAKPFESCGLDGTDPSCAPTNVTGPLVLAHGSLDDEGFVELLLDLQAVQRRYKVDQLRVLALTSDPLNTLAARRDELSKLRRLELEVRRVDTDEKVWREHYRVEETGTVMFVDGDSTVRYSQVAPARLDTLDAAIVAAGVEVDIAAPRAN